ncbi:hypothetical protein [Frateuria sp. YIM B11624]|uniref:hypothetical protein n=1 Tax=Frateuria sp. YIM B11624 TaxID=3143185 RepID=UPI003C7372CA
MKARALLLLVVLALLPWPALALGQGPDPGSYPKTYEGQHDWCVAYRSWMQQAAIEIAPYWAPTSECQLSVYAAPSTYVWRVSRENTNWFSSYRFDISTMPPNCTVDGGCVTPPGDICKARPSYPGIPGSNINVCLAGCSYKPTNPTDGTDGSLNTCVKLANGTRVCGGAAVYKPTGDTCGSGPGGDTTPPPAPPPPPKLCGGGSCYNPTTGDACALDANGNQVCHNIKPGAPGGCISSGETTLCTGNPPPMPPTDKVPDPPSDIVGSDDYTQQPVPPGGGAGGTVNNTTVNNYNNGTSGGDGTANNGGGPGDSGTPTDGGGDPAPGSSSGGPPVTSSGGGTCGTPPIVTGDAAAQQIAYQAWATRCAIEGQNKGLGTGQVGELGTLYTPSTDTVSSVVGNFQTSVQETPIGKSMTSFFTVTGMGGACPVWTLPASDWLPEMTFDFYCRPELGDLLDLARIIILITCAYAAFRIALGDS